MAVSINFYDQFMEFVGDGGIDLDTDTFKLELYDSVHAFTPANTARANVSANALGTAFGYTSPGQDFTGITWITAGSNPSTQTFDDTVDQTWTASGGSIGPATDGVIYSDTSTVPATDLLMCSIDFDGPETAGDGTDFKVTINASGIFTVAGS